MVLFSLKTLFADRGKLLIALVGVTFSFVLVNVQGGLFLGMIHKATVLVDNSGADIWIGHRGVEAADLPLEIPEAWLNRIKGLPGVERAEPYIVWNAQMSLPNGEYEGVWIIGSKPSSTMGHPWAFSQGSFDDLTRPDSIAVDELDGWKLGYVDIGDIVEINGARARIVAKTRGILNFLTTPCVFTSLTSARRYTRMRDGYCSFFLVKAAPGQDPKTLCRRIQQRVPDLDVFTAAELARMSQMYWIARTGLGMAFGGATALGLVVGLVMVAQSLYALVLEHLDDYATLLAIGAEDGNVLRILICQALTIALVGIGAGVVTTYTMQYFLSTPYATIAIPLWLPALAAALVVVICLLSSVLPFRRVRRIDPAIVLQG